MRTMRMPVEAQVGAICLRLDKDERGYLLQAKAVGVQPLDPIIVRLKPSAHVKASPVEYRFGTLPVVGWTAAQRVKLEANQTPLRSLPESVSPVYVLEFDAVVTSTGERMIGAFHISFG